MRGLKNVVILLSVSLNAAFVAAWSARSLSARSGGVEGRGGGTAPVDCPLYRDLGLTEDQRDRIGPRLREFQDAVSEECSRISRVTGELIDLVAAPEPDFAALAAKQKEILAARERMQARFIDHLLEQKRILNPDQQRRLFEMIRRGGCGCHGGRGRGDCPGCRRR